MNFIISQKEQLHGIINHYGADHQKDKLFEEMAELQKEVCKEKDGKKSDPEEKFLPFQTPWKILAYHHRWYGALLFP